MTPSHWNIVHPEPPGATRRHPGRHSEPPGDTHPGVPGVPEPPGATRSHPEPPGATRSHLEPPGATRSHPEPPGTTRNHPDPPKVTWGPGPPEANRSLEPLNRSDVSRKHARLLPASLPHRPRERHLPRVYYKRTPSFFPAHTVVARETAVTSQASLTPSDTDMSACLHHMAVGHERCIFLNHLCFPASYKVPSTCHHCAGSNGPNHLYGSTTSLEFLSLLACLSLYCFYASRYMHMQHAHAHDT